MTDLYKLKSQLNLLNIAQHAGAQLRRIASTGGGEWAGACPFCGGHDRFRLQPNHDDGGIWLCRKCTDGKWMDVISFVMRNQRCDFKSALATLTTGDTPITYVTRQITTALHPNPASPPAQSWQKSAQAVVTHCVALLWSDGGIKARTWLHSRGLKDDTIREWQLGYLPGAPTDWHQIGGLSVATGIVIPCEVDKVIWYIKVRRANGLPKYVQVKGGKPALYGAHTFTNKRNTFLCEGEFDTMLLHQEAGDIVGTATLGSASVHLDVNTWAAYLLQVTRLWIAYDTDHAGDSGADQWTGITARARRIVIPCVRPGAKDLTDYALAGGSLRDLVTQTIAGTDAFVEEVLAWGKTKGYQPVISPSGHIVMHRATQPTGVESHA